MATIKDVMNLPFDKAHAEHAARELFNGKIERLTKNEWLELYDHASEIGEGRKIHAGAIELEMKLMLGAIIAEVLANGYTVE